VSRLTSYTGKYTKAAILTPVWTALVVVINTLVPYATGAIIDKGITAGSMPAVYRYGALTVVLAVAGLCFGILSARYGAYSSSGFAANLRSAMYSAIQRFTFSDIDRFTTASLVTRMTTDVSNIQNAFQMLLRISVRAPLTIVSSLFMCLFINTRLAMIFFIAMIVLSVTLFTIIRKAGKIFAELMGKYDVLNGIVRENVSGMKVVKSFVREKHESLKFRAAVEVLYRLSMRAEVLMSLNGPVMNLVSYGCMIALSWFGARFIVAGDLTCGELTALFTYVMAILMSLMMLSMIFVQLTMSLASAKRIREVLDNVPDMKEVESPIENVTDGSIDFRGVSFTYPGTADSVLKDVSLHIDNGQTIGIIGATGGGKSTFVNLIDRLYDVTEGTVMVGGHDVRSYSLRALRNSIATVPQKSVLFRGTVNDNLRWGKSDATREQIIEACQTASADGFVRSFPNGYDSMIEQGGTNVSGGQMQRLCIARALLKDPKILILDDSTSALDTETEKSVCKALREKCKGKTLLMVSQRISTIVDADMILVLDNGRVSGFGPHEELLGTNSIYREIWDVQNSGAEKDFDKA